MHDQVTIHPPESVRATAHPEDPLYHTDPRKDCGFHVAYGEHVTVALERNAPPRGTCWGCGAADGVRPRRLFSGPGELADLVPFGVGQHSAEDNGGLSWATFRNTPLLCDECTGRLADRAHPDVRALLAFLVSRAQFPDGFETEQLGVRLAANDIVRPTLAARNSRRCCVCHYVQPEAGPARSVECGHIVSKWEAPRARLNPRGAVNGPSNLVPQCSWCNQGFGSHTPELRVALWLLVLADKARDLDGTTGGAT